MINEETRDNNFAKEETRDNNFVGEESALTKYPQRLSTISVK